MAPFLSSSPLFSASASRINLTRNSASASSANASPTLVEALRNKPFSADVGPAEDEVAEQERVELNEALHALVILFPDIKTEVFHDMLKTFDGESRLQICVDQLLRHKAAWVKGRWNVASSHNVDEDGGDVDLEDQFRSARYKMAVRRVLRLEFPSHKSSIDGVLAEGNFSYARARPIMTDLAKKGWKAAFGRLFSLKSTKKPTEKLEVESHPLIAWRTIDGVSTPELRSCGDEELDRELFEILLAPWSEQRKEEQQARDRLMASRINEKQAKEAEAMYECECCFTETTFENIVPCSINNHIICSDCVRRTLNEAIFGQGWSKSVDHERGTLKCISPLVEGVCEGCLSHELVKRAVLQEKSGVEIWRKFNDRLAEDTLLKAQVKLVRCPFCPYAEVDSLYVPKSISTHYRLRRSTFMPTFMPTILSLMLLLDLFPFVLGLAIIYLFPSLLFSLNPLETSLRRLADKYHRCPRFTCRSCSRTSCLTCEKPWRDPHTCNEPLVVSLRTTVEAARTAAVKRTCPRCGTAFVKSSGCNKLTCPCGYSMCYLCRKALGPPLRSQLLPFGGNNAGEAEDGEGYRHFCEHFRATPGSACTQCDKCDLYRAENEDEVARKAGEQAEREWRVKEGMVGVRGFEDTVASANGPRRWWEGFGADPSSWSFQGVVDAVVERVIEVRSTS